jgi:HK97 gp10 family phage protein
VIGLEAVLANLARKGAEIVAAEDEALVEAGEEIRRAWVENIESEGLVLTGAYRDSVRVEVEGAHEAAVLSDVHYAGILEFGDSRQAAHPVAERAFDEHHDDAVETMGHRIEAVVR